MVEYLYQKTWRLFKCLSTKLLPIRLQAVEKVKQAIEEFVSYVRANEPGTRMYIAWQQQDVPTRFIHLFIFEDSAAQTRHSESEAVRRFEAVYSPELVGGEVVFTDFNLVASNKKEL